MTSVLLRDMQIERSDTHRRKLTVNMEVEVGEMSLQTQEFQDSD